MKKYPNNFRGLLLPNEVVPSFSEIKRNLLFFDKLDLVSPYTNAVLLDKEVSENLIDLRNNRNATISWAARGIFPRSESFVEDFNSLNESISALRHKDLIRIVGNQQFSQSQALFSLTTYASAISQESIIKASLHDYKNNKSVPYNLSNQIMTPLVDMSLSGFEKSDILKNIKVESPFELDHVDSQWSFWGNLRIGRMIRSLMLCEMYSSFPISTDITNAKIIDSFNKEIGLYKPVHDELLDYSLSLELFDIEKMNEFLDTLDWSEYLKIRKKFRPHICGIRNDIVSQNSLFSQVNDSNIENHINKIRLMKSSYEANLESWKESLHKLRLGALIKSGEALGVGIAGNTISSIASLDVSLTTVLTSVLSLGLISLGRLKAEIQSVSIARSKIKKSKLHIFRDYI
ncbi:hypothetical protein E9993_15935 [Labilibacter sediminis]|nr:hypothetical protein E9993_15935 [Labilibacter sediminis]